MHQNWQLTAALSVQVADAAAGPGAGPGGHQRHRQEHGHQGARGQAEAQSRQVHGALPCGVLSNWSLSAARAWLTHLQSWEQECSGRAARAPAGRSWLGMGVLQPSASAGHSRDRLQLGQQTLWHSECIFAVISRCPGVNRVPLQPVCCPPVQPACCSCAHGGHRQPVQRDDRLAAKDSSRPAAQAVYCPPACSFHSLNIAQQVPARAGQPLLICLPVHATLVASRSPAATDRPLNMNMKGLLAQPQPAAPAS